MKAREFKAGMVLLEEDMDENPVKIKLDSVTPGNGIVRFEGHNVEDPGQGVAGYMDEDSDVEVET